MMKFWVFLHFLGFSAWLGGGFAAMMASIATRGETRAAQGIVARMIAAVYARVIGPGAALAAVSGIFMTMTYMGAMNRGEMSGAEMEPPFWLGVMQGAGLLGAALIIGFVLPATSRVARLDPVAQAEAFDALRRRQRLGGMIATTFAVLALVAGAMLG